MTSLFGQSGAVSVNVNGTLVPQSFTGTAGQTLFTITNFTYTPGTNSLLVFINGQRQIVGRDFTETSNTSFTFLEGVVAGDFVDVIGFPQISLTQFQSAASVNFIPKQLGSIPRSTQDKLREVVSVSDFGAIGDGSLSAPAMYAALLNAFNSAIGATPHDLYFPSGTYDCGEQSFPFRNTINTFLLDCKNLSIICSGPKTILKTTSVGGSDVLQLNAVKNLSVVGFPTLSSTVSGVASGSNGCSITNGWDNIYLEINPTNCTGLDKTTFIDGGRGLTIQTGTGSNLRGRLRATVLADSCTEGFGYEPDLFTSINHPTDIEIDLQARNCYIGVKAVSGGSSGPLSSNMTMGLRVRAKLFDCQHDVVIQRMHGLTLDYETGGIKTAAQRRINPNTGISWFAADAIVDSFLCSYLKNGFIRGRGNKGACDYKVQIGGASSGASGLAGSTQYCDILLDIGGVSAIADLNSINSGGNSVAQSKLDISPTTAPGLIFPIDWTDKANYNKLTFGGVYQGSFVATLVGVTTVVTGTVTYSVDGEIVTLSFPQLVGLSNTTGCSITGLPSNLITNNAAGEWPSCLVTDNGITGPGRLLFTNAGAIILNKLNSSTFTAAANKGLEACTISYKR